MGAQGSKLSFRRGIFRLFEEENIPENNEYWSQYWLLPESAEDVFTLFSVHDVRKARDQGLNNLETLLRHVLAHLFELAHGERFSDDDHLTKEVLNCLRLIARIVPIIYEGGLDKWEDRFWWTLTEYRASNGSNGGSATAVNQSSVPADSGDTSEKKYLAEQLTSTLTDLLFYTGFTIPFKGSPSETKTKVSYSIWETGVGCNVPMGTNKMVESNRIEVLRALLAVSCKNIYRTSENQNSGRLVAHLVSILEKKVILAMLCSLLNTVLKFNPVSWRIPYNHVVFNDSRQLLVTYCIQLLLILLTHPISEENLDFFHDRAHHVEGGKLINQFRHYFGKLHRANDIQFMLDGINRVLNQPVVASASYLPGSQKPIRCHPEMLLLFLECLQNNRRFRTFIIESTRALDFLILLLFYAVEYRNDPTQAGLVRLCAFTLQPLSAESKFCVMLNTPFEGQSSLPASMRIPAFRGTYGDFLIISIYTLVATTKGALSSIYPALFLSLANIAPYLKNTSVSSATKLIQLLSSISSPSFVLANETNHNLLRYMLEAFNGIIENQFNDNVNVIYSIIRSHEKFEAIRDFDLQSAQATVEAIRKKREILERASKGPESSGAERSSRRTSSNAQDNQESQNTFDIGGDSDEEGNRTSEAQSPMQASAGSTQHSRRSSVDSGFNTIDDFASQHRIMSEKARGKLPEGRLKKADSSMSMANSRRALSVDTGVVPAVQQDFIPTQEWVDSWHSHLDMHSIMAVIERFEPQVHKLLSENDGSPYQVLEFLRNSEPKGLVQRAPNPRTFVWNEQAILWFDSLLWGYIYISETDITSGSVGVWSGTKVRLFRVHEEVKPSPSLLRPRGAVDAMAKSMFDKLGSLQFSGTSTQNASDQVLTTSTGTPVPQTQERRNI